MKKITVLVFALVVGLFASVYAVEADFSVNVKAVKGQKSQVILWDTHTSTKPFIGPLFKTFQYRSNFDWTDSEAIFLGNTYEKWGITINPEIGVIWSQGYKAVSPEIMAYGDTKRMSWVTLNQLSIGTANDHPNFLYHWLEVSYKLGKKVKAGITEQTYLEYGTKGASAQVDIGPVAKYSGPWNLYLKASATINPDTKLKKYILTIGTGFN